MAAPVDCVAEADSGKKTTMRPRAPTIHQIESWV
jgi:hypothetical protein